MGREDQRDETWCQQGGMLLFFIINKHCTDIVGCYCLIKYINIIDKYNK